MFRLIWIGSVYTRYFLRRYMPTNILLDAIRTRRGLKWGVPALLLVLPYLYVASLLMVVIEARAPHDSPLCARGCLTSTRCACAAVHLLGVI